MKHLFFPKSFAHWWPQWSSLGICLWIILFYSCPFPSLTRLILFSKPKVLGVVSRALKHSERVGGSVGWEMTENTEVFLVGSVKPQNHSSHQADVKFIGCLQNSDFIFFFPWSWAVHGLRYEEVKQIFATCAHSLARDLRICSFAGVNYALTVLTRFLQLKWD